MKIISETLTQVGNQFEMFDDSKVYCIFDDNDYNLILEKIKNEEIDNDFDFGDFLFKNGIDYDEVDVKDFIYLDSIIYG